MHKVTFKQYNDWLAHIGVDHLHGNPGSGRYRWGSGKNPGQHTGFSMKDYEDLKKTGLSDKKIGQVFDMGRINYMKDPDRPYQKEGFSYKKYIELVEKNVPEKEIAKYFNILDEKGNPYIQGLRDNASIALAYERRDQVKEALRLEGEGYSRKQIAEMMGLPNESSVRSLTTNPAAQEKKEAIFNTADVLRNEADMKGVIHIGTNANTLGVSDTRFKAAIRACENAGYNVYTLYVNQLGSKGKQQTPVKVLAKPGMTLKDANEYLSQSKIGVPLMDIRSEDNGLTFYGIERPVSIDSKRVGIGYDPNKDGLVEIRRGVEDVSLGKNRYAQVRVAVDDKYYIKGMAVYSDNLPDGVDILVNTKKPEGTPLHGVDGEHSVLKELKTKSDGSIDWDNPFGAMIKMENGKTVGQRHYTDENGKDRLSPINIINEEGDWAAWKKTLSAQFLSKQSQDLIKQQLDISKNAKQKEFDEINAIENPTVRKRLLMSFADECDAAAADLKAASMPRQASHVIIPIESLKDNEIYAPGYENGEKVILIRYPHAGKFEIPELIVNNNNVEARNILGTQARDAVGITQKTAQTLSGADFDGDTVLVIPNNDNRIEGESKAAALFKKELGDFDPNIYYNPNLKPMKEKTKQIKMGETTNLIQDMELKGAPPEDMIPAVKYSMVIIDAKKHSLDYKQAYKDYNIAKLKEKYRGDSQAGASTIITRAGAQEHPLELKKAPSSKELGIVNGIDVETGKKVFTYSERMQWSPIRKAIKDENGKVIKDKYGDPVKKIVGYEEVRALDDLKKMDTVGIEIIDRNGNKVPLQDYRGRDITKRDAYDLVGNPEDPKERLYANFANSMKQLANEARRIAVNTENLHKDPDAVKTYAKEVESLTKSLQAVKANSVLEIQALALGNKNFFAIKKSYGDDLNDEQIARLRNECIAGARLIVGAKKPTITISPSEWKAIDAGAISSSTLVNILQNTSLDTIRSYTMPRQSLRSRVSYIDECLIKSYADRNVTPSEIAKLMGFSTSTIYAVLRDE